MAMPELDASPLDLYRDKAGSWRDANVEAMRRRELEENVRVGLFVLEEIQRHNALWGEDIERGKEQFSWESAERFANEYRAWQNESAVLRRAVGEFEQREFAVDGAGVLREKYREVALLPLDISRVRHSIETLEHGKCIPLLQAMDELHRHEGACRRL